MKVARIVLRGRGGGNVTLLPDKSESSTASGTLAWTVSLAGRKRNSSSTGRSSRFWEKRYPAVQHFGTNGSPWKHCSTYVLVAYRWQNIESSLINTRATSCRTEPADFIAKLAAQVPKPRVNLTRLCGDLHRRVYAHIGTMRSIFGGPLS